MTQMPRMIRFLAAVAMLMTLVACQSNEERAEAHYQSALALLQEDDFDRARVEFQNVFQLDGLHLEARTAYANALYTRGEIQEAYSQFLRLVEQDPDNANARLALAEMAIQIQNIDEAERHGRRAIELASDDPRAAVIEVSLAYATAISMEDELARMAAFSQADTLLVERPDDILLLNIIVDNALRASDFDEASTALDRLLAQDSDNRALHNLRLSLLAQTGDAGAVETQLLDMLTRFPADRELPATVLRFYMSRGEIEQAIAFLQDMASSAQSAAERQDAVVALVQLSRQLQGPEAALAQISDLLAEGVEEDRAVLGILQSSIMFDQGDSAEAIVQLEALLDQDLSPADQGRVQVTLAQMLQALGNIVGARALVEQVLETDPTQADALKLQAGWFIAEDRPDDAIGLLRTVLDNDADDVAALSLMAQAHNRNGTPDLAREFLALAANASNGAPAETLRYVAVLRRDGRLLVAEEILIDALRLTPDQPELLAALGELYVEMEDWPRATQVETTLRGLGDEQSTRVAAGLEAARLAAQGRTEEVVALLQDLASTGDLQAQLAVLRTRLASGDAEGAQTYIDALVDENPDQVAFRIAQAAVQSATGNLEAAEASFRALTETAPGFPQAWIGLLRVLNQQGRTEDAMAVLEQALQAMPEALDLLWAQASFREQAGDYEGAIETYEVMYGIAPGAEVVANNLASLLSTYRDDPASLERAWTVARRLRGSDIAPFQDTFGWIAYQRGEYDVALEHLEPAATGLPDDPLVQFHLGMTYLALERPGDALTQLRHAVDLAGDDPRDQFNRARTAIAELEAESQTQSSESRGTQSAIVSSAAELAEAYAHLSEGAGGVIYLSDAANGLEVSLSGGGDAPVTIRSADPGNLVQVNLIFLSDVQRVTITELNLEAAGTDQRAEWIEDVMVMDSRNVSITGIVFEGDAQSSALTEAQRASSLGQIRNSQDVVFSDNTVRGYFHGLTIRDSVGVEISDSIFTHMQGDGIRMGGVEDVLISGNVFRDWYGSSHEVNHDDMIQLWTTNAADATRRLTISDNLFYTGNGVATQTIFLGNESLREGGEPLLHESIVITNNLVYGGHFHGISVYGAHGVVVSSNTVLWNEAATMLENDQQRNLVPSINLGQVLAAEVAGNITSGLALEEGVLRAGNRLINYRDPGSPDFVNRHFHAAFGGNQPIENLGRNPDSAWLNLGSSLEWHADTLQR